MHSSRTWKWKKVLLSAFLFFSLYLTDELFFNIFHLWKTFDVIFVLVFLFRRRRNKHFDVSFRWIKPVYFLLKDRDDVAYAEEIRGKVLISHQSRHFFVVEKRIAVIFLTLYFDLACKQLYFICVLISKTKVLERTIPNVTNHFDYQMTVLIAKSCLF